LFADLIKRIARVVLKLLNLHHITAAVKARQGACVSVLRERQRGKRRRKTNGRGLTWRTQQRHNLRYISTGTPSSRKGVGMSKEGKNVTLRRYCGRGKTEEGGTTKTVGFCAPLFFVPQYNVRL
jgi:hypothetical protein